MDDQHNNIEKSKDAIFVKTSLNATIFKEKPKMYVAHCEALDLYSQGETRQDAEKSIIEATHLFIKSCVERNTLTEVLTECGFRPAHQKTRTRKTKTQSVGDNPQQINFLTKIPSMIYS